MQSRLFWVFLFKRHFNDFTREDLFTRLKNSRRVVFSTALLTLVMSSGSWRVNAVSPSCKTGLVFSVELHYGKRRIQWSTQTGDKESDNSPPQKKIISFHLRVATNSNTGQNVHSVIKSVKETSRMTGL